jgi:hypothetical protein
MFGLPEHNPDATTDWYCTPPEVLEAVYRFWSDGIDLDPCSNEHSLVVARRSICLPEDGLTWDGWEGRVWVNPPYSDPDPWLAKCDWSANEKGAECLAFVKVDTSTQWWRKWVWGRAQLVCFWHKRVAFYLNGERQQSANFPSALVLYCHDIHTTGRRFSEIMQNHGHCAVLGGRR